MTLTELTTLVRTSPTFKADVDAFFSDQLPRLVSEINALLAGGISTTSMLGSRNRLDNSGFSVNQREVSGTVSLSAGQYGHDRWKAGASGCVYTFSTVANVTTITIVSGSLLQVIEGVNIQSGAHVLGWDGSAQGRVGGGSYAASPVLVSTTGGANLSIEFNAGTLSFPQLEAGSERTTPEIRNYSIELSACQRYYERVYLSSYTFATPAITNYGVPMTFHVTKRTTPTITTLVEPTYTNLTSVAATYFPSKDGFAFFVLAGGANYAQAYNGVFEASAEL